MEDALIEAARKGHLKIVRRLVTLYTKKFHLQELRLEKLVRAATSCGNDQVLKEMLNFIPRNYIEPEAKPAWISDMFLKACWLGNGYLVDVLLNLGADPQATIRYSKETVGLLHLAIQSNQLGVIKLLLKRHISLNLDDASLPGILGTWASQEVTELLLAKRYKFESKSKTEWTALQYACSEGRPIIADLLLTQMPKEVDYIHPNSPRPILCAVWFEKPRTIKVPLKHGLDVNEVSSFDHGNALYLAVQKGRLDIFQLLLEHKPKIDINYTVKGDIPPIIMALSCSPKVRLGILRLSLDNGADPDRREGIGSGQWGRTALLWACAMESQDAPEIIRLLLDHSVDIEAMDYEGWTPAYTAAAFGLINNLRLLVDAQADLYAACGDAQWNTLQAAYANLGIVRLLLDKGMDPFNGYDASLSALQLSARYNQTSCVKFMLHCSEELKESAMNEALHNAVIYSCPGPVRYLLDEGADVNHTHGMNTLLSLALETGYIAIIRMLLEFRLELDHKDMGDKTLLHFTAANTTMSTLKLLVNAGAKVDGLDNDGESPLSCAVRLGNIDAVRYLLTKPAARLIINKVAFNGAPLHQACRYTSMEMAKTLIDNGADVNLSHDDGLVSKAPIFYACTREGDHFAPEKDDLIKYLLEEAGADITGKEYESNPIHLASLACSGDLIKLFIRHGVDTQLRDEIGRKPVHMACYNSLGALEALNPSDQEFAARDKLGRVPLHFAVLSGQLGLLEHVLERSKSAGLDIDVTDSDGWTPLL